MHDPSTGTTGAPAFSTVRIRVGAALFCGERVCVIRRDRPAGALYTLPGGKVEPGEPLEGALARELSEELRLEAASWDGPPELLWVQDQMVARPGPTPPPRKLHLVYRLHIGEEARGRLAEEEHDAAPNGRGDTGRVEWRDYRTVGDLALFPAVGGQIAGLETPVSRPDRTLAPPMTDITFSWR
ncbi:ADP-ribose pyrophosphatase YjhB (NUDIX family) [Nocardiopsis mwathae]|uniref:ADP-ribose pyrophosphatase YjhB (NUDIX family) n=1 Tax=Nocardiopsis mwathae TaxID=1472723 RepID=A0A7W9YH00_9ACTN|nr:ADP-ribose pyrophosphatase YjhB (NUDIX family) [Nocardiopsis mwathae]